MRACKDDAVCCIGLILILTIVIIAMTDVAHRAALSSQEDTGMRSLLWDWACFQGNAETLVDGT